MREAIEVLEVSAGNIRSLGPAGCFDGAPFSPYIQWLEEIERTIETLRKQVGK